MRKIDEERDKVWSRIVSHPNADRYVIAKCKLNIWDDTGLKEAPDRLQDRFNFANELIAKAEAEGLDINNTEILQRLGKEVNIKMDGVGHKIWSIFK
jgi:hypothetical protein